MKPNPPFPASTLLPFLLVLSSALFLAAQDTLPSPAPVFTLGEVLIEGGRFRDTQQVLSIGTIQRFNKNDVAGAVNLMPGVVLGNIGPRNEAVIYVRGFDPKQVPIFVDGIPVYVPFDGYADLGRFLTADLSMIQVDKGLSSVLYGPNAMGGAINLVTRKPVMPLEINGEAGWMSGRGYRIQTNIGSRFDKFYVQGGFAHFSRESFPLSKGFEPVPSEDGGLRNNAYRKDWKINLKVAYTPNGTDEYAIGYVRQDGEKGNPPYTGTDRNIRVRFWQWPYWDKESIYFLSNTALGDKAQLKFRLYHDTYKNALFSYDDDQYATQTRPFAFQSFYDDYTYGGNAEFKVQVAPGNLLKIAAYLKHDTHRENDLGQPVRTMSDNTISLAVEDIIQIGTRWSLTPGISYNLRKSLQADNFIARDNRIEPFPDNDNEALNAQTGLYFQPSLGQSLRVSMGYRTRFATFKDRYSYRLGLGLPNPDLLSEYALHYEIAYSYKAQQSGFSIQANAFLSNLGNAIQQVDNVQGNLFQLQNTGKARFSGLELGLNYPLGTYGNINASYSFIEQRNLDRPEVRFVNVPKHKVLLQAQAQVLQFANILAYLEHNSQRFSTSYGTTAEAFTTIGGSMRFSLLKEVSLDLGIRNIFDVNYALIEGFPEEGRNYYITLIFNKF